MSPLILVATHLTAAAAGAVGGRYLVVRAMRDIIVQDAEPLALSHTRPSRSFWFGTIILVASMLVVGIGIQAKLAADDNRQRDQADRRYANCLTNFADTLVDSLQKSRAASKRLEKARAEKDDALDQIVLVVIGARSTPPTATEEDFTRSLTAFAEAKAHLAKVQAQVQNQRQANPYVPPKAVCQR